MLFGLNGKISLNLALGIPLLMLLGHVLVKPFLFIYKYINFYFFKPPLFDHGHAPLIAMILIFHAIHNKAGRYFDLFFFKKERLFVSERQYK